MLLEKLLASVAGVAGGAWIAVESLDVLHRWSFALHQYAALADRVAVWGN